MTGYTVHSGTTVKFSESWDRIFQAQAETIAQGKGKKGGAGGVAKGQAKAKTRVKRKGKGQR